MVVLSVAVLVEMMVNDLVDLLVVLMVVDLVETLDLYKKHEQVDKEG